MTEKTETITSMNSYCPICDATHLMYLKKLEVDTEKNGQPIKYVRIFNYCANYDYEIEIIKDILKND